MKNRIRNSIHETKSTTWNRQKNNPRNTNTTSQPLIKKFKDHNSANIDVNKENDKMHDSIYITTDNTGVIGD